MLVRRLGHGDRALQCEVDASNINLTPPSPIGGTIAFITYNESNGTLADSPEN